jgi:hypothetical protein
MAEHHGGVLVRQVRALGHLVPALGWVPWSWESQRASALARTTSGVPAGQPGGLPPPRPSPAMSAQPRRGYYLGGGAHAPPWAPASGGPTAVSCPAEWGALPSVCGAVLPGYLGGNWDPGRLGGPGVRGAVAV